MKSGSTSAGQAPAGQYPVGNPPAGQAPPASPAPGYGPAQAGTPPAGPDGATATPGRAGQYTKSTGPTDPTNPLGLPDDLIVTGEAVALDLRPAMLLGRVASALIDIAAAIAAMTLTLVLGLQLINNQAQASVVGVVAAVLGMVALPTAVETLSRGRSLGKFATGIQIVRDDGGPVRFRHAFVRALVGTVEIWLSFGSLAVITSLINARGKRLGDLLAGTYAARIRGSDTPMQPLLMPPELQHWAASADIRPLPSQLALQTRILLSRTGSLEPAARVRTATVLAAAVEEYVAPPPPWGTNPERFLAATLVARRDREYAVAVRRRQRESTQQEQMRRLPHEIPDPD